MRAGPSVLLRGVAAVVALSRLARAIRTRPPVEPLEHRASDSNDSIDVVVPARNEADRIGPLLDALGAAPGVRQVIVVDDESDDATASIAAAAGARVVPGRPRPPGWAGKTWALQQGLDAATREWIVTLDADTRPDRCLPASAVARADRDRLDLLTLAGRFDVPTAGARWLHPALLTTLVYRFGPPGASRPARSDRMLANGQCMVFRREALLERGGWGLVAASTVEDVALARLLAGSGWSVDLLDAMDLLAVRTECSLVAVWSAWGRSIGLPTVEARGRAAFELVVLVLAMPLPALRMLLRRGDVIDAVLLAARLGTLVGTRRAYERAGAPYWLSPLADLAAVATVGVRSMRRTTSWRGRRYPS